MKKLMTICAALVMTASVFAQAPEKMSYQAVVRDGSNNLVSSSAVGMRIQILQGSQFGAAVYVETQTPTTNTNGLLSIEIGTGTVVSGNFTTIDWSNGPYFIKTETDPTGGTSYTITGTSELLSVPYALHAKTAESISGGITETDPVYGASVASGITGTNTTNWDNKQDQLTSGTGINITGTTISNTAPDQTVNLTQGGATTISGTYPNFTISSTDNNTTYTSGTGITITGTTINARTYSVGDFAQGGIVFWVDETGQHGLVCAKIDQSTGVRWYAGTNTWTMARGDGPLSGEMNTALIIAGQSIGDGNIYAARICNELQITQGGLTYGDWYLPSKGELTLMYQNKVVIDATAISNGGSAFAGAIYWSSNEDNTNLAWYQNFGNGSQGGIGKTNAVYVRAVRTF